MGGRDRFGVQSTTMSGDLSQMFLRETEIRARPSRPPPRARASSGFSTALEHGERAGLGLNDHGDRDSFQNILFSGVRILPTTPRREKTLLKIFLSAYENDSWADANLDWLDEILDGAVEVLVTRKADGKTLAIEHTIIEPFRDDKYDFARFERLFLPIENDPSLIVPHRIVIVYVPVGTLQQGMQWDSLVRSAHEWLKANILSLPTEWSNHRCTITGTGKQPFDIKLTVRVIESPRSQGKLLVRRQQVKNDLGDVIDKALGKKLPKLVNTIADKRILLLERQHMNLFPKCIIEEIGNRKVAFPKLTDIHEIWIVETMFFDRDGLLRFELYRGAHVICSLDFQDGAQLFKEFVDTTPVPEGVTQ
ncbi:MAG: hypothetical protein ACREUD_01770 [Gammaproteobacteria bacterium]